MAEAEAHLVQIGVRWCGASISWRQPPSGEMPERRGGWAVRLGDDGSARRGLPASAPFDAGAAQRRARIKKKERNMNFRSKPSLAAIAAVLTVVAMASAEDCAIDVPTDPFPLASEQDPITCDLNGASSLAFAIIDGSGTRLVADLIDPTDTASFADSLGYDENADRVFGCQAIDTNRAAGFRGVEDDPTDCIDVVLQDLALEFNEG